MPAKKGKGTPKKQPQEKKTGPSEGDGGKGASSSAGAAQADGPRKGRTVGQRVGGCFRTLWRLLFSVVVIGIVLYLVLQLVTSFNRTYYTRCFGYAFPVPGAREAMLKNSDANFVGYGDGHGKCEGRHYFDLPFVFGDRSIYAWAATYQGPFVNGAPHGKQGQYVEHSAWFEYVHPPYRFEVFPGSVSPLSFDGPVVLTSPLR
jgi:hypothetical protein